MLSGMSHPQRATASAGTLARKAQQNSPDASCRSFSSCASLSRVDQSEHQLSACWAISLWKARNSKYGQHLWSTSMCSMAAILPRLFVQFPTLGAAQLSHPSMACSTVASAAWPGGKSARLLHRLDLPLGFVWSHGIRWGCHLWLRAVLCLCLCPLGCGQQEEQPKG